MQFSSIPALGALFAIASASLYTTDVAVVCSGVDPTTVYQTVTITAPYFGGNNNYVPSNPSPYVTTVGNFVTSVNYSGSQTSVWVYPTGSASHDCTVAIYEKTTIINVIIVNINISIINGETKTVTSIVTSAHPTFTPVLPPMPRWNTTSSTRSMPIGTSYHNSTSRPTSSPTGMHKGTGVSSKPTSTRSTSMHMGTATTFSTSSAKTTSVLHGTGNIQSPSSTTVMPTLSLQFQTRPVPTVSLVALPKRERAEPWFA